MVRMVYCNDADAADAMQDTVLSCYENLQSLREPKYFQTLALRKSAVF